MFDGEVILYFVDDGYVILSTVLSSFPSTNLDNQKSVKGLILNNKNERKYESFAIYTFFKFDLKMNVDVPADDDGHGDDNEHENNKPTTEHQK